MKHSKTGLILIEKMFILFPMELFVWPYVFLLLPLPYVVRRMFKPVAENNNAGIQALRVPFFQIVEAFTLSGSSLNRHKTMWPLILAWIFCVCAAARPVWFGDVETVPQTGRHIVLTLDVSESMTAQDFEINGREVNRLDVVKLLADDFLQKRTGDELSLVIFGNEAYTYTPLTRDTQTVRQLLGEIDIGIAGNMTAIGDALALSVANVSKLPAESRIVILLSDGTSNAGVVGVDEALKMARKLGVKVYTLGIGAGTKTVRDFFGFAQQVNPSIDLDEETLRQIAKQTGGQYFRAKTTADLKEIYDTINKLEPVEQKGSIYRPRTELFWLPLLFSLICLFVAVIKRRYV